MKDFLQSLREANIDRNGLLDPQDVLTPLFFSNELGGEVGEAQNVVKKLVREEFMKEGTLKGNFSTANNEDLARELADVVICVDLLAMKYGIDLREAIEWKFNHTSAKIGIPVFIHLLDKELS